MQCNSASRPSQSADLSSLVSHLQNATCPAEQACPRRSTRQMPCPFACPYACAVPKSAQKLARPLHHVRQRQHRADCFRDAFRGSLLRKQRIGEDDQHVVGSSRILTTVSVVASLGGVLGADIERRALVSLYLQHKLVNFRELAANFPFQRQSLPVKRSRALAPDIPYGNLRSALCRTERSAEAYLKSLGACDMPNSEDTSPQSASQ